MNPNRAMAVMLTIASLSVANVAGAAEAEDKPLVYSVTRAAVSPMVQEPVLKRPAIVSTLYVSLAAMQAWDVYSTTAALKAGAREANPVAAPFTGNPASMIGLKAVSTASTIYIAERMWKKNRVKAIVVLAAINGATAAVSMHNMRNAKIAAGR